MNNFMYPYSSMAVFDAALYKLWFGGEVSIGQKRKYWTERWMGRAAVQFHAATATSSSSFTASLCH